MNRMFDPGLMGSAKSQRVLRGNSGSGDSVKALNDAEASKHGHPTVSHPVRVRHCGALGGHSSRRGN